MAWKKGQTGNPLGAQSRDKPFRDALRMEIAQAGPDLKALRRVAAALLDKAAEGDVLAIREIADRLDGKVSQESTVTMIRRRPEELSDDELTNIAVGSGDGAAETAETPQITH